MVDNFCFLHSLTTKTNTHGPGENAMSTGFTLDGFPSMGAWTTYALGSEADDLPAFVAIPDPRGVPQSSINNWGAGFLPATFQGNFAQRLAADSPSPGARRRLPFRRPGHAGVSAAHECSASGTVSQRFRIGGPDCQLRTGRAHAAKCPEVLDLASEPEHIWKLYGADDVENPTKAGFARNCILARRLLERGVRFVQLFNGAYAMGEGVGNWDGHKTLKQQYDVHGPILDQPAADC
jgi:hypothetical protein